MSGLVTRINEATFHFESANGRRWVTVKRRDWFERRESSYHAVFSNGMQVGGEWRWPALYNYCARWVLRRGHAD